jgi:hypothetical protein
MTIEQIIALTQAGFTKDDILAMNVQTQQMPVQTQHMPVQNQQMPVQNQQMPVQTQQMPVQTQQMPVQTQQMPVQKQQMQTPPSLPYQQMPNGYYSYSGYPQNINQNSQQNDVLDALKNLTRSVQNNNVNMMQNQMPKQVTTEDAIASIINPPNYEGLTDGRDK